MFSHNACPNIYTKKLLVLHCDLPKVKQIKIIFQLQELQILLTITEKKKIWNECYGQRSYHHQAQKNLGKHLVTSNLLLNLKNRFSRTRFWAHNEEFQGSTCLAESGHFKYLNILKAIVELTIMYQWNKQVSRHLRFSYHFLNHSLKDHQMVSGIDLASTSFISEETTQHFTHRNTLQYKLCRQHLPHKKWEHEHTESSIISERNKPSPTVFCKCAEKVHRTH